MLTKTWPSILALGFALLFAVWAAGGLVSRGTVAEDVASIRLLPTGSSTGQVPAEVTDTPREPPVGQLGGGAAGPVATTDDNGVRTDAPRDKGDGVDKSSPDLSPAGGDVDRRGDDDRGDGGGGDRDNGRSPSHGDDDEDDDDDRDDDEDDDD